MPFEKGNKLGRGNRKARDWEAALRRAIGRRQEKDPLALEKLADKLLEQVDEGEILAIKELADRLDGKAIQTIDQTVRFGEMSDAELDEKLKSLISPKEDAGSNDHSNPTLN